MQTPQAVQTPQNADLQNFRQNRQEQATVAQGPPVQQAVPVQAAVPMQQAAQVGQMQPVQPPQRPAQALLNSQGVNTISHCYCCSCCCCCRLLLVLLCCLARAAVPPTS